MAAIKTWSTTAASNNAAAPDGFPENMAPSGLNDACREMMAALATWYRDAQWVDLNDIPTYASATTFTIAGDVTATYHVGRRLRLSDSSTRHGTIGAVSYGAPNTTVTVLLDSGSLSASLSAVAVSLLSAMDHAVPSASVAKPAFLAFLGSSDIENVTGAGTTYTIAFDTESYDVGAGFDTGTGVFTAPIAGYYQLDVAVTVHVGVDSGMTAGVMQIVTTDLTYRIFTGNPYGLRDPGNNHVGMTGGCIAWLDKGDTARVQVQIGGGSGDTVDIAWASAIVLPTYFAGRLLQ